MLRYKTLTLCMKLKATENLTSNTFLKIHFQTSNCGNTVYELKTENKIELISKHLMTIPNRTKCI